MAIYKKLLQFAVVIALVLTGCKTPTPTAASVDQSPVATSTGISITGRVEAPKEFKIQATANDVLDKATVTLSNRFGRAITSGLTNASGVFSLSPSGFIPDANTYYILEAVKGLGTSAPSKAAARFRTYLKWSVTGNGWTSISNSAAGGAIVLNPLTTAVALISAMDATNVTPNSTIGKVDASVTPAVLAGTYSDTVKARITEVKDLLNDYLGADQDPTSVVNAIVPAISSLNTQGGNPGDVLWIYGNGFIRIPGENTVKVGTGTADIILATPTRLVVKIPANATSGTVTVSTALGGTSNGISFTIGRVNITVDPAGYLGAWHIPGVTGSWQYHKRQVSLTPSRTYWMQINGVRSFKFSVDTTGKVTMEADTYSDRYATGGNQLLTFKTLPLTINVNGMETMWYLWCVVSWQRGNQVFYVIPSNRYRIYVYGTPEPIYFDVDEAGVATPVDTTSATGGNKTITFDTVTVTVNPNGFERTWMINGERIWKSGQGTVKLPKDRTYSLGVSGIGWMQFNLNAAGTAITTSDNRITANNATITYNTTNVNFVTNGFGTTGVWAGHYWISGWPEWYRGNRTFTMLRGHTYSVRVNGSPDWFTFTLDGTGNVQANHEAITGGGNQVSFNVQNLTVSKNGYVPNWGIPGIGAYQQEQDGASTPVPLVKGVNYTFLPENTYYYRAITIRLKASGDVMSDSSAITTGIGTIALKSETITVDPSNWALRWSVPYVQSDIGQMAFKVLKNRDYIVYPNSGYGHWRSAFNVGSTGAISNGSLHTGGPKTLTFNTQRVQVAPYSTQQRWYIWAATPWTFDTKSIYLLKGLNFRLHQYGVESSKGIAVDLNGNLTPTAFELITGDATSSYTLTKQ